MSEEKNICVNCKYCSGVPDERILHRKFQVSLFCLHPDYVMLDYITGKETNPLCYRKNSFGECLKYEPLEDDTEIDPESNENTDPENNTEPTTQDNNDGSSEEDDNDSTSSTDNTSGDNDSGTNS